MPHNEATSPSPMEQPEDCVSFHTSDFWDGCRVLLVFVSGLAHFSHPVFAHAPTAQKQQPLGVCDGLLDALSHLCMTFTTQPLAQCFSPTMPFTEAVCVWTTPSQQQEQSENTMRAHTQWFFGFGL